MNYRSTICSLSVLVGLAACQQPLKNQTQPRVLGSGSVYSSDTSSSAANLSNVTANLTPTERTAVTAAINEMNSSQQKTDSGVSDALKAEAERLFAEEKKGLQRTAQKLALGARMMQECAARIAKEAPRVGQDYVGLWRGKTCSVTAGSRVVKGGEDFTFEITGDGLSSAYQVNGGFRGQMGARPDGSAIVQGSPWSGELSDNESIRGTLYNSRFNQRGSGYDTCEMDVVLESSRNPVPEQYIDAINAAGNCYRNALALMSPSLDAIFDQMDPALAAVLQAQMLGLNTGR